MALLPKETVQSQYSTSEHILSLVENYRVRLSPEADILKFYTNIFNIDTAQGIGLDIWGRILGIPREIEVEIPPENFGFYEGDFWGFGDNDTEKENNYPLWTGKDNRQLITLLDGVYRDVLLWKAFSNVASADAFTLNQILQGLFPGQDVVVRDVAPMVIGLYFFTKINPFQRAMLRYYGLLAKGAGVGFLWWEIQGPCLGFSEDEENYWYPFDDEPMWSGNLQGEL